VSLGQPHGLRFALETFGTVAECIVLGSIFQDRFWGDTGGPWLSRGLGFAVVNYYRYAIPGVDEQFWPYGSLGLVGQRCDGFPHLTGGRFTADIRCANFGARENLGDSGLDGVGSLRDA
jgi:hypothetical protein